MNLVFSILELDRRPAVGGALGTGVSADVRARVSYGMNLVFSISELDRRPAVGGALRARALSARVYHSH